MKQQTKCYCGHTTYCDCGPLEEPKQETLTRDYSNRNCKTCNLGQEGHCELKLESKCASYANDETLGDYWISCLDDESDSVLYKQETLEEARANSYIDFAKSNEDVSAYSFVAGWDKGARWQQEQYTVEEQHVGHTIDELDKEYIKGFNEGSAYQQERSYSEEEVIAFGEFIFKHSLLTHTRGVKSLFEQFKKK